MNLYFPNSSTLAKTLEQPELMVVMCFCAAWCDACKAYQPKFDALVQQHPNACFIWIDIEDYPELLGDEDVENFPTIAIMQKEQVRFFGTVLPHIEHLNRLIQAMQSPGATQPTGLPNDLVERLKKTSHG
ncbi:MAG: thioredoxin family protein [Alcaligenaceae bacterium]|jgi:thioredoxin 1